MISEITQNTVTGPNSRSVTVTVLKSAGPRLVPFFKTAALFFILFPGEGRESIWYCLFKCAPVVSLMAFVLMHGMDMSEAHSYSRRIFLGLLFSCVGDAFLVWQKQGYFLYGMATFAIAQGLYASAFGFRPLNASLGSVLTAIGITLYYQLLPGLRGVLVYATIVYMMLIGVMLWRAISRVKFFDDQWTWTKVCSCIGAISFAISDTVLAFDRFYVSVPYSQTIIMFTYYLAQLGIAISVMDSHAFSCAR